MVKGSRKKLNNKNISMRKLLHFLLFIISVLQFACSSQKQAINNLETTAIVEQNLFATFANTAIFSDSNFISAHVGISIYNPETQQYLYNYQGDKYFVPASNMKLFTCYAAMKNLGDSLVGLRYFKDNDDFVVQATGDPTFLHPDFKNQPVFNFLKSKPTGTFLTNNWDEKPLGNGWAWNDYSDYYMAERSPFPVYGNTVIFSFDKKVQRLNSLPTAFNSYIINNHLVSLNDSFSIKRKYFSNEFEVERARLKFKTIDIPFVTDKYRTAVVLLNDTIKSRWSFAEFEERKFKKSCKIIHSQPTDSLLKPMMHRSDNFFAEQTLLMVSNEKLGIMNDEKIIDTLLKTDFAGLPQKPKWVDGSGLSRYNLITPQDFVWVLTKMKNDFPWQRITNIMATGNEGTLNNYYKNLAGNIYAKTGTLSGQVALSGYLITKQNKTLVFSVLVNNHQTSATAIRRGIEQFLNKVYEQY